MQAAAPPGDEPFGIWLIIERETNMVVGDVGFHGRRSAADFEIGFSVIPDRRRRGYASEAARAIVEWATDVPDVREVVARSDVDNVASARTLVAAGFARAGERDGQVRWRRTGAERLSPGEFATDRRPDADVGSMRSTKSARHAGASKGFAKYSVTFAIFPSRSSPMPT